MENSNSHIKIKKINKYFLLFIKFIFILNKLYIIFIINNNLYLNIKINMAIGDWAIEHYFELLLIN